MAAKQKILVLGGGFGGIFAARKLARLAPDLVDVELISRTNYFIFQPLLPEVAAGAISAADAVAPIRALLPNVRVRQAEIVAIDLEQKRVEVAQGTGRRRIEVGFDHLVLALGQVADLSRVPGANDHALALKNLSDAFALRNHVLHCLELADVTEHPEEKKRLLTFVVIGAGFSGTETVGELADLVNRSLRFYRNIERSEVRFVLMEYADRILPELPQSLADYAVRRLADRGVDIMLKTALASVTDDAVTTGDGRAIETWTAVATIGNAPSPLITSLDLPMQWGKVRVDRHFRVEGFNNLWAVGDAALVPLANHGEAAGYAPPTAQFAVREGRRLAHNIVAEIRGTPPKPFEYASKGALTSLGMQKGVATVYGVRLTGFPAWLLWRSFYLSFLPGWATKIRVAVNWFLDTIVSRNTVQTHRFERPATRFIHYRAGDTVFEPGMRADGFYMVLDGSFELVIDHESLDEPYRKTYRPGDHFGERAIFGRGVYVGSITASEDSRVLVLRAADFERFVAAFPAMKQYFDDYLPAAFPPALLGRAEPATEDGPEPLRQAAGNPGN